MEAKKNYIKPVTYEGTQIIMEQMKKGICKIKNEQNIGTGFFCKVPLGNNIKIKALITSYQIIDDYYLNNNSNINLYMSDNNEQKIINLGNNRNIYSSKNYNTTIIELKDTDNINYFLELDDNLFRNDLKIFLNINQFIFCNIYLLVHHLFHMES